MEVETEFYISRDGEDIDLIIRGDVEGYVPAKLSGHPDTWEPAEGPYSEVTEILLEGKPWDGKLSAEEKARAEDVLYQVFIDEQRELVDCRDWDDYL
jgi:hypothetical protein